MLPHLELTTVAHVLSLSFCKYSVVFVHLFMFQVVLQAHGCSRGIAKILTQVCFPGVFHPYDFYSEQVAWRGFCLLYTIQNAWDEHAERKNRSTEEQS